jgi:hypothetical protein
VQGVRAPVRFRLRALAAELPNVRTPATIAAHARVITTPASHGFAPTEMTQFALLGAASAGFSKDDARNAAQINQGKRKRLLIQPNLANPKRHKAKASHAMATDCPSFRTSLKISGGIP